MPALNLRSPDLATAYNAVLSGDPNMNWALFSDSENDLKVSATGGGGLEELQEEFSDGRIQYAFVRVVDPNSKLNKFVQINWLGEGVPEAKRGLFYSHSDTVSSFLKGAHVTISARNEADVIPEVVMAKVNSASGSKYSISKETPRKYEPIAPLGTAYSPVGKIDIAELRKNSPRDVPQPAQGSAYVPVRHELPDIRSVSGRYASSQMPGVKLRRSPEISERLNQTPLHTTPPVPAISSPPWQHHSRQPSEPHSSSFLAGSPAPHQTAAADIGNGTGSSVASSQSAYQPVSMPPPRKLVNPFATRQEANKTTSSHQPDNLDGRMDKPESKGSINTQVQKEAHRHDISTEEVLNMSDLRAELGSVMPIAPSPPLQPSSAHESEPIPGNAVFPHMQSHHPVGDHSEAPAEDLTKKAPIEIQDHSGLTAVALYPYEAIESNEVDLFEGEIVSEIEHVDEGWWRGTTSAGQRGLFPANYVRVADNSGLKEDAPTTLTTAKYQHSGTQDQPAPSPSENGNLIAIAAYSYTAMEDNEISFSEGDEIFFIDTSVSEDWWQGTLSNGASGLFPGAGPLNPAEWPISNPIPLYSPYYHTKATYVELQK